MNSIEKKAALTLSSVFALRMLGLFMLLPVFSVIGQQLDGYTPALVGLAIGAYGLTQALFQIPFGWMSDRYGRKPIILFGLVLFVIGSVVAAMSEHIYGVIAGRLLQGGGAIASAIMALAADLSRDEQRTKIMASIGMSIGAAFAVAMIIGPTLASWVGLQGLFLVIACLAVIAMLVIYFLTPDPEPNTNPLFVQRDAIATKGQFSMIFKDGQLMRLNFGIFTLHFLLTSFFVAFPNRLLGLGVDLSEHSWIYLITMVAAVILMLPMIILAEKKRQHARVMLAGVMLIAAVQFSFGMFQFPLSILVIAMILYFTGFNLMEALLPSMISRMAPLSGKGTALGVYSTSQFAGAFLGGPIAGLIMQYKGMDGVYLVGAFMAMLWALLLLGLKNPPALTSYTLTMPDVAEDAFPSLIDEIKAIEGVSEAIALPEAGAVYLKIDKEQLDQESLAKYSYKKSNNDINESE